MLRGTQSISAAYIRNFVFGVEDSLVSTVGFLSGVAIAGISPRTIFVSGAVLIFVEGFSMAAGSFLSEHSVEDYLNQTRVSSRVPLVGGIVMFISYFVAGFIPLAPYVIFSTEIALPVSITASCIALFLLGAVSAHVAGTKVIRSAVRMFLVGGGATALGILVGRVVGGI